MARLLLAVSEPCNMRAWAQMGATIGGACVIEPLINSDRVIIVIPCYAATRLDYCCYKWQRLAEKGLTRHSTVRP